MTIDSDSIIAIIFILILLASILIKTGFKKPILAQIVMGTGALGMATIAYLSHSTVAPAWIVGLLGLIILAQAWSMKKKSDQ